MRQFCPLPHFNQEFKSYNKDIISLTQFYETVFIRKVLFIPFERDIHKIMMLLYKYEAGVLLVLILLLCHASTCIIFFTRALNSDYKKNTYYLEIIFPSCPVCAAETGRKIMSEVKVDFMAKLRIQGCR